MTTVSLLDTIWWFRLFLFGMLVGFSSPTYRVDIQPENGPLFIQVGNSLELNCTVTGKDLEDLDIAQYLSWKFFKNKTGQEMESRIIDGNISTLVIDDVGVNHTGAYVCYFNDSQKDYRMVNVGYPPNPPKDFYCVSHDYLDLICKWKVPKLEYAVNWTLYYKTWISRNMKCNSTIPEANEDTMIIHGCNVSKEFSQAIGFKTLSFTLIGQNKYGSTNEKIQGQTARAVVKMSSFKKVYVQYSNSTSLKLVLKLPDSASYLPSLFDTMYRVLYKSKWDDDFKMVKKTVLNDYFKNTPDTLTLTNLVPNTNYNISVSAKIVDAVGDRYWSDPFIMTGKTGCDVPGALPEFTGSSFQITQQIKTVKIYMKPLPDKMKNSPFVNYSLTFEELGKNGTLLSLETRDYPESVMLHPNVQLNLNNEYNIKIQVFNEIGMANKIGTLHLPSSISDYAKPDYVMVEKDSPHKRYLVSWFLDDLDTIDIAMVTYYWCKQWSGDNVCHENLNWSIEPSNTTSLSININEVENFDKWIFGVSLEKKNNFSSGISWGNCYFSHFDQVDDIPSPNFFSVQSVRGSEKALEVKITGYCNILNGNLLNVRPDNYTIIYGKISDNITVKFVIEANTDDRTIIIPDLEPFTQYFVAMKTGTRAGFSQFSSWKIVRTEMIAPSTKPKDINSGNITGSSFTVTWGTTENPNGPIISYDITLEDSVREIKSLQVTNDVFSYTFNNLDGYTNYTVHIRACNKVDCSPAGSINVITLIKAPEGLKFNLEKIGVDQIAVLIQGPEKPNAPDYFYMLKLTKIDQNFNIIEKEYSNLTERIVKFNFSCTDDTKSVKIAVDAIGKDENGNLYIPAKKYLQEEEIGICPATQNNQDMYPVIAGTIGGCVTFVIFIILFLFVYKSMREYCNYNPEIDEVILKSPNKLFQDTSVEDPNEIPENILPKDELTELKKDDSDNNITLRVNLDGHDMVYLTSVEVNDLSAKKSTDYVMSDEMGHPLNNCTPPNQDIMTPVREGETTNDNSNFDVEISKNTKLITKSCDIENILIGDSALKHDSAKKLNQDNQTFRTFVRQTSDYVIQDPNNGEILNTQDNTEQLKRKDADIDPIMSNGYVKEADLIDSTTCNQNSDVYEDQPENSKSPANELDPFRNNLNLKLTKNAYLPKHLHVIQNSVENDNSEENDKILCKDSETIGTDYVTDSMPFFKSSPYMKENNSNLVTGTLSGSESMADEPLYYRTQDEILPSIENQNLNPVAGTLTSSGSVTDGLSYYRKQDETLSLETANTNQVTGTLPGSESLSNGPSYYRKQDECFPYLQPGNSDQVTGTLSSSEFWTDKPPCYGTQDENIPSETGKSNQMTGTLSGSGTQTNKPPCYRTLPLETGNSNQMSGTLSGSGYQTNEPPCYRTLPLETGNSNQMSNVTSENQQKLDGQNITGIRNENHGDTNQEHYIKLQSWDPKSLKQMSMTESNNEDSSISPVSSNTSSLSSLKDLSETENLDNHKHSTKSVNQTETRISTTHINDMSVHHDLETVREMDQSSTDTSPNQKSTANNNQQTSSVDYVSCPNTRDNDRDNAIELKTVANNGQLQWSLPNNNNPQHKTRDNDRDNAIELKTVANNGQLQLSLPNNNNPQHKTEIIHEQSEKSYIYQTPEQSVLSKNNIQDSDYRGEKRTRTSHLHQSKEDSPYVKETSCIKTNGSLKSDLNNNGTQNTTGSVYNFNMTSSNGYVTHSQISTRL